MNKSLNPTKEQILTEDIRDQYKTFNKNRRIDGLESLSHSDICEIVNRKTVYNYINQDFKPSDYWRRFSKRRINRV